jgi:hypothetical protein
MKLYYPKVHYDKNYRAQVFPLLKPFMKNKEFTDSERIEMYGVSDKDFCFVSQMADADYVILPMSWNYYVKTKQQSKAKRFIHKANKLGKIALVVTTGDYGVLIPVFKNAIILRTSGSRSLFNENHQGIPVFIVDPLVKIYDSILLQTNYSKQPIIGFCGQTNDSIVNAFNELVKVLFRNVKFHIKLSHQLPQHIQSTTFNRSKVLEIIKKSKVLTANFIERKKYRAGVVSVSDRKTTELEFYNNMLDSNYVVCIRGAGNFSVRLYETLAMGRIPVFINTDCILPLPEDISWNKHAVWVEFNELDKLEEKVFEFHNRFSEEEFKNLQISNRKIWEDKLTLKGFFKTLLNNIEQ